MLRPYQLASVEAVEAFHAAHAPALKLGKPTPAAVVELPTGAGKTHVIAELCRRELARGGRVLCVAHRKELLEQGRDKLATVIGDDNAVGYFSASLKEKNTTAPVTFAGIASVVRSLDLFPEPHTLILIDECHRVPTSNPRTMYQRLIADAALRCPSVRVVGLTATPYRLDGGHICTSHQPPCFGFTHIVHRAAVTDLMDQGFLCRLRGKCGKQRPDLQYVTIKAKVAESCRYGEYDDAAFADAMTDGMIRAAATEIAALCVDRRSILVFASGVKHAQRIHAALAAVGIAAEIVVGETTMDDRDSTVARFKSGEVRCLINCMVFTEGFDAPNVDCVVLMRATTSTALYYQMVGRGLRTSPNKADCLVLDYGENIVRHGPIDDLQITVDDRKREKSDTKRTKWKECKECGCVVQCGVFVCPDCGFKWPDPSEKVGHKASDADIIGGVLKENWKRVQSIGYHMHYKSGDTSRTSVKAKYKLANGETATQWVAFGSSSVMAAKKAAKWWRLRGGHEPPPPTASEAMQRIGANELTHHPSVVELDKDDGGWDIVIPRRFSPDVPWHTSGTGARNGVSDSVGDMWAAAARVGTEDAR